MNRITHVVSVLMGVAMIGCATRSPHREAAAAASPRERISLDFNWRFLLHDAADAGNIFDYPEPTDLTKTRTNEIGLNLAADLPDPAAVNLGGEVSFVQTNFSDARWRSVDLPHDWVVELPFDQTANVDHGFKPVGPGFPQNNIGWYRRTFELPASDRGRSIWIEFDGVYRNSVVWLNGHCLGRHVSGYTSFRYDISKYANFGGSNILVVRADASRFEGWFYEGAGIYRHVWLVKSSPVHVAPEGVFVWTRFDNTNNEPKGSAAVHVEATLTNALPDPCTATIRCELIAPGGKSVGSTSRSVDLKPSSNQEVESGFRLIPERETFDALTSSGWTAVAHNPILWSPESPSLYQLVTTVESAGKIVDRTVTEFGIRTIAFDPEKGFLLNGRPYEIKGTCNHQDHAGVGTAMPDALQYYRIKKLKEMGSNAYRTSHNPPTPELLEACDRLGMLVMDENRRFDTNTETLGQLRDLVIRDRNHPSVFIWSIANEEKYLQNSNASVAIACVMQDYVHKLDPMRPVTYAANNGARFPGINSVIEVRGWNYNLSAATDSYHKEHPAQPNVGTEQGSTIGTRGIYASDRERGYASAYDDNDINPKRGGGRTAERWWNIFAVRPWLSGAFIWTGFDYRGEPTPYKWPCINSHFGVVDTCGFPKDNFYFYQSWWSDKPVLHILPHWNWPGRESQAMDVRCFSNCKEVELFLNGTSLGRKTVPLNGHLAWEVRYVPGVLSAKGYDGERVIAQSRVETTGAPAIVQLEPDRTTIAADGQDVSVINVCAIDAEGRRVPTADNLIHFSLSGPGRIIGVGNGDPSSHEPDKATQRKLFCGYAQVIVQSTTAPGKLRLTASADGLKSADVAIAAK